ncbi:N-acetyltransferase GCN5 [Marinobacterium nitratireducens]|uniref:N-acetyltransferase GCN5 n=1 Tax=Marinobacterium nitratireducens TaxID=518897 RepID=A0A917ZG37_9GAMM|nr:GNAT family N-acetyltransferase [Marinobacterium nitratireducens]GGO81514.1 N-acetyltransferase GCN5 [Marinobacterium nitratireducens]
MTPIDCDLRRQQDADYPFIERLYASTRAAEMASCGWPPVAVAEFLRHQCQLQYLHYRDHFPDAEFWIVERQGTAIGRLYLSWGDTTLQLIDIALLPEHRGKGIGSALLDMLLTRADKHQLAVGLHVEIDNPARLLYLRLGFETLNDEGLYLRMQRAAASRGCNTSRDSGTRTATEQGRHRGAR